MLEILCLHQTNLKVRFLRREIVILGRRDRLKKQTKRHQQVLLTFSETLSL